MVKKLHNKGREENYEEKGENDKEKTCLPPDSPFLPVPSVCLITTRIKVRFRVPRTS